MHGLSLILPLPPNTKKHWELGFSIPFLLNLEKGNLSLLYVAKQIIETN
jgi:hypothetical protein